MFVLVLKSYKSKDKEEEKYIGEQHTKIIKIKYINDRKVKAACVGQTNKQTKRGLCS